MEGRLLGRIKLFEADDENTSRSAAGRAALEAVYTPASLLPQRGVSWRAERERHRRELGRASRAPGAAPGDRRPRGRARLLGLRWGDTGQKAFGYMPCGCEVGAERCFGDLVVPSRITGAWWFGTPRQAPFYRAEVRELAAVR
jgi:hypothetical protein